MEEGPNGINQRIKRTKSQRMNQELSRRLGPSQAIWLSIRPKCKSKEITLKKIEYQGEFI